MNKYVLALVTSDDVMNAALTLLLVALSILINEARAKSRHKETLDRATKDTKEHTDNE